MCVKVQLVSQVSICVADSFGVMFVVEHTLPLSLVVENDHIVGPRLDKRRLSIKQSTGNNII
jgi:hypothetical protein